MGFPGIGFIYNLLPYLADWAHHLQPGMDDGFKRGEFIASSQAAQCALLVQHLEKLGGSWMGMVADGLVGVWKMGGGLGLRYGHFTWPNANS